MYMSFKETYQYEDYGQFFDCPDGDLPVKILSAKETTAKSSSRMIEVNLLVTGAANKTPYVERYVEGDFFNRNMSRFFDAFGIQRGNFDYPTWVNKNAVGHFEHKQESYQSSSGEWKNVTRAVMKYLLVNKNDEPTPPMPQQHISAESEEIKKIFALTFPDGKPVFTQTEVDNYRKSYANGTPLSSLLKYVKSEADKRLSLIVSQSQNSQTAAIDDAVSDFIF